MARSETVIFDVHERSVGLPKTRPTKEPSHGASSKGMLRESERKEKKKQRVPPGLLQRFVICITAFILGASLQPGGEFGGSSLPFSDKEALSPRMAILLLPRNQSKTSTTRRTHPPPAWLYDMYPPCVDTRVGWVVVNRGGR